MTFERRPRTLDSRSSATLCVRAGQGKSDGEPLVLPIVQSTTFFQEGLESQAKHRYSRESNPTVAALEQALGDLEDAPPAVCYATGLAAEAGLFTTLLEAGEHVVASRAIYGGTTRLLEQIFPRFGIGATFVDTRDLAAVQGAIRPETKLVFLETPANPTLDVTDIEAVASIAHDAGALVAVDNTFLTAVLQRPLELGADISVYSTTKLIDGHSVALGGALVTRDKALLERLAFTRKCTGGVQAPFNAWLTLQGLKTLPLRIAQQSANAEAVASWLKEQPETLVVHYPGMEQSDQLDIARRQHLGAHGAVVSFELEGGQDRARRLLQHVRLCTLVEHVGAVQTLLTHSASMTHAGVARADRERVGVTEGLLRISVGLEDPRDVIEDLGQAMRASEQEVLSCTTSD